MFGSLSDWISERSPVNALIFPAPPSSYDETWFPKLQGLESTFQIVYDAATGSQVPILRVARYPGMRSERLLLFCHGNGCDLRECLNSCGGLARDFGCDVIAVEYPGYGIASRYVSERRAQASAAGCVEFALFAYRWAISERGYDAKHIIVCGHSIGTGVALEVADLVANAKTMIIELSDCKPRLITPAPPLAVVLFNPFTTIKAMAARVVGKYLASACIERFNNLERIGALPKSVPVVIVHGTLDSIIPHDMGVMLTKYRYVMDMNPTQSTTIMISVVGGGHDMHSGEIIKNYIDFSPSAKPLFVSIQHPTSPVPELTIAPAPTPTSAKM